MTLPLYSKESSGFTTQPVINLLELLEPCLSDSTLMDAQLLSFRITLQVQNNFTILDKLEIFCNRICYNHCQANSLWVGSFVYIRKLVGYQRLSSLFALKKSSFFRFFFSLGLNIVE